MDDPQAEVEIKPQLKPRGSVAKEEDPKPSHKMQVKYTGSTRQTPYFLLDFLFSPTSVVVLNFIGTMKPN